MSALSNSTTEAFPLSITTLFLLFYTITYVASNILKEVLLLLEASQHAQRLDLREKLRSMCHAADVCPIIYEKTARYEAREYTDEPR